MTTQSKVRVPKAELNGVYGRVMSVVAKKMWGEIPDVAYVMFHNKQVTKAVFGFEGKVKKFDKLDPTLSSYAQLASAAVIGCSWCLDFGYFMAHNEGLDATKVREVPRWRDSEVFTELERDVLEYAEAMTLTPPTVDDWMVEKLTDQIGVEAMVELTMMVAIENQRSRFNSAMGLASQGYSDRCELAPLPMPATAH